MLEPVKCQDFIGDLEKQKTHAESVLVLSPSHEALLPDVPEANVEALRRAASLTVA